MRAVPMLAAAVIAAVSGFAGNAAAAPSRYVVVPGDSLSLIAQRVGVPVGQLARVNRLDADAPLLIGTVLRLPGPKSSSTGPKWPGSYLVAPGDTLGAIATHYGITLAALAQANRLNPAAVLLAGTKLHVPTRASGPGVTLRPGVSVTVQPGQTLSGLAARFGVSLTALSAFNHIDPNGLLLVGQRLTIPSGAGVVESLAEFPLAQASPYPAASIGLDVSYPDCAAPDPAPADFTIIGLNFGRPFTTNPCFAEEYAAARAAGRLPSVYLNSAYAPSLIRHVTEDCLAAANDHETRRPLQLAYAVGCSEAEAAQVELAGAQVAALWIDVEPANTWSKSPLLNRATIKGLVDRLLTGGNTPIVGAYSADVYWQILTGGWSAFALPEWIATGGNRSCASAFASGPVWLSQRTTTHDFDSAC